MSNFIESQPIILASGSKIRARLLKNLGIDFSIVPPNCDEQAIKEQYATDKYIELGFALAKAKAQSVSTCYPDHLIIAADQLCIVDGMILDKPLNHDTAVRHLNLLQGKEHRQIAFLCIAKGDNFLWEYHDIAHLKVHSLSQTLIEEYLHAERPYHSCGAYQYETLGKWLFKEVRGNEDTILGLPLVPLRNALTDIGAVHFTHN